MWSVSYRLNSLDIIHRKGKPYLCYIPTNSKLINSYAYMRGRFHFGRTFLKYFPKIPFFDHASKPDFDPKTSAECTKTGYSPLTFLNLRISRSPKRILVKVSNTSIPGPPISSPLNWHWSGWTRKQQMLFGTNCTV